MSLVCSNGGLRCLRKDPQLHPSKASQLPIPDEQTEFHEEKVICCRQCSMVITSGNLVIEVGGQHRHTFFNPAGILFQIGCFSAAPGCSNAGVPTQEFSWFPGFAWRYSLCSACQTHLGWHFSSKSGSEFFGLVLDRLLEINSAHGQPE